MALATREDDALFSSFIDSIVLAPIHAQKKDIRKETSMNMPLVSIFGTELSWALRDAVFYSGNYDEVYTAHFGEVSKESRGRNRLNDGGGPQMHSFGSFGMPPFE